MKKNKLLILALILITPLIKGNAPSPYPFSEAYGDFTTTALTVVHSGTNYLYKAEITNTGTGYINLSNSYLNIENERIYHNNPRKIIILPNETHEVTFIHRQHLDISDFTFDLSAYIDIVEKTTFSDIRNFEKRYLDYVNPTPYWGYHYEYQFDATYAFDDKFFYEMIITYKHEDNIITQRASQSGDKTIYFNDILNMEQSEFEVLDLYTIRGRERRGGISLGALIVIGYIIGGLLLIPTLVALPIGIVLLTIYLVKKYHARKKESE